MTTTTKEKILDRILNEKMAKILDKDKALSDAELYINKHYNEIIYKCNQLIEIIQTDYKLLQNNLKIENDKLDESFIKTVNLKNEIKLLKNIHYKNNKSTKFDLIIQDFIPIELNQVSDEYVKEIMNDFQNHNSTYMFSPIIKKLIANVDTNPIIYNFLFKNLKFELYHLNNEDLLKILPHLEYFKIPNDINYDSHSSIIDEILNSHTDNDYKQNLLYKLILLEPKMLNKMEQNFKFMCFLKDTKIDDMTFLIYNKYSDAFINMYVNNNKHNVNVYHKILEIEPLLILLNNNFVLDKIFYRYLQIIKKDLNQNYNINKIIKVLELSSSNHFCNPQYPFLDFFNAVNKLYLEKTDSVNKIIFKCSDQIPIDYSNYYSDSESDFDSDSDNDSDNFSNSDSDDDF